MGRSSGRPRGRAVRHRRTEPRIVHPFPLFFQLPRARLEALVPLKVLNVKLSEETSCCVRRGELDKCIAEVPLGFEVDGQDKKNRTGPQDLPSSCLP